MDGKCFFQPSHEDFVKQFENIGRVEFTWDVKVYIGISLELERWHE